MNLIQIGILVTLVVTVGFLYVVAHMLRSVERILLRFERLFPIGEDYIALKGLRRAMAETEELLRGDSRETDSERGRGLASL